MGARGIIRLLTTAAAAVLAAAVATPASAAGPPGGDYYQKPTPYDDHGTYDPGCTGLHLTVTYRQRGVEAIRNLRGSDGQAFLDDNRYRFRESWADDSTGHVVITIKGAFHYVEASGHRVPTSSVPKDLIPPEGLVGPIFTFRSVEKGHDVLRDAHGKALFRDRGKVVGRRLFDTLGDSKPGGTTLDFRPVKVVGPHPLLDVDVCDVVAAQLHKG